MQEGFVLSKDDIQIHYLSNGVRSHLLPIVIVPGMLGVADHYVPFLESFDDRLVVAITHRGLGKSGAIQNGEGGFLQRASDIGAVVGKLGLKKYFLYGFSRGVALSVQHALDYPLQVEKLIIHDCEPIYLKPSKEWVDFLVSKKIPHASEATIKAYWSDAENIDLTDRLAKSNLEVMIYYGEKEGSLLPKEKLSSLLIKLQKTPEIIALKNSAHEMSDDDLPIFISSLKNSFSK